MTSKLSRYVSKEVIKTLVPAFLALALIMILGFSMQLLHEGLDVVRLPGLLPPVFIYCIPLVLPPAFLTAVITVFGRLSGDNEILAMQAAGVRLHAVVVPTLILALFFSIAATAFQFEAVPYARRQIKTLKYEALKQILMDKIALRSRTHFSFGRGHLTYDAYRDGKMINPTILETKGGLVHTLIRAKTGKVQKDPEKEGFVLFRLQDTVITRLHGSRLGSGSP
ncbi:MAG: LptF/LptG family permease, partial [Planctomycetota bacterium]